jgi:hypothetical protein
VSVADHGVDVRFGWTSYVTPPLPTPPVNPEKVTQETGLDANHEQTWEDAAMLTSPDTPAAGALIVVGSSVNTHAEDAWVTVKACPAIVRTALRVPAVAFGCAVKVTVPLPVPFAPAVMDSQASGELAVHEHPLALVVTATETPPPLIGMVVLAADRVKVHASAAWVRVNAWPTIVIVPLRGVGFGLADAEKLTDVGPVPDPADVRVIHDALLFAVQAHPTPVARPTAPVDAALPTEAEDEVSTYTQLKFAVTVRGADMVIVWVLVAPLKSPVRPVNT